jgi:uncharacterized membrane protein (GlpM family)
MRERVSAGAFCQLKNRYHVSGVIPLLAKPVAARTATSIGSSRTEHGAERTTVARNRIDDNDTIMGTGLAILRMIRLSFSLCGSGVVWLLCFFKSLGPLLTM